ncbi:MAG: Hercynine oxygenase [Anaerolineales bacterium]|nr:Hercynine oxygenase [Anaerolineales bacterium]
MNLFKQIVFALTIMLLLLSACAPAATSEPPTPTLVEFAPSATPAPSLVPVVLGGPQAGSAITWTDGGSLVYVPAGQFSMGADGADNPRHGVNLSAYWIHKTKITNRMYALCVGVGVCEPPSRERGAAVYSDPTYADHPVVGVNWEQASAYCGWVGGRLPTEAEWEKAARGPGAATFPWGEAQPSCSWLNFGGCKGSTSSVVAFPGSASPYGALDMAGNVFEWNYDWYDANYFAASPIQDPPGPDSGQYKSIRGSSFESEAGQISLATRHFGARAYTSADLGFRCVVQQPINFPPFCQASAYQPGAAAPAANNCPAPNAFVSGYGCNVNQGFSSVDMPLGSDYKMLTPKYECVETLTEGILRVTCYGPDNTSGEMTVCDPACGDPTPAANNAAVCDPGYSFDPATRQCVYAPALGQPGPQGCPPGYALDSTGQICRPTPGLDNQCPLGQYFDALFGSCVPANQQVNCNLYGLDNPSLAGTCYLGCPAGFAYDSTSQCCQSPAAGLYPSCQPGFTYDPTYGGCVSGLADVSGAGCTTISVDMLQCGEPYPCGQITSESVCIRNQVYGCTWDDKANVCINKK